MIGVKRTLDPDATSVLPVGQPELPLINLLPARTIIRRKLRMTQAKLGAGVMAAVLLVVGLTVLAARHQSSDQRRLDAAQSRNAQYQRQIAGYAGVAATYRSVDTARATLRTALSQEVRYSRLLTELSTHVPPTVQVTTASWGQAAVGVAGAAPAPAAAAVVPGAAAIPGVPTTKSVGTVTIGGLTASHDDVATWLESLAKSAGLANPILTTATKATTDGRTVVTFSSTAVLTPAALSGRYAGSDGGLR
jgi:Tfp pilus assembly protein PilN